jgi:hypothetical protein
VQPAGVSSTPCRRPACWGYKGGEPPPQLDPCWTDAGRHAGRVSLLLL